MVGHIQFVWKQDIDHFLWSKDAEEWRYTPWKNFINRFYSVSAKRNKPFYSLLPNKQCRFYFVLSNKIVRVPFWFLIRLISLSSAFYFPKRLILFALLGAKRQKFYLCIVYLKHINLTAVTLWGFIIEKWDRDTAQKFGKIG